jgi:hypothetical protein
MYDVSRGCRTMPHDNLFGHFSVLKSCTSVDQVVDIDA